MYLLNDEQTSYEKMGLDINIYKLEKYYKENLENVNEQIASCIEKFHMVGIELNIEDFNYVSYVKEYMEVFLQELQKDDIHSKKLKTAFEQIYWKCPDIIRNIALNFRNIYLTKQNIIDKYFEKEKNARTQEILKEVYEALVEKGYNPINQIVGYILSGDPTYITSYKNARNKIRQIERDELLDKMVRNYIGLEE